MNIIAFVSRFFGQFFGGGGQQPSVPLPPAPVSPAPVPPPPVAPPPVAPPPAVPPPVVPPPPPPLAAPPPPPFVPSPAATRTEPLHPPRPGEPPLEAWRTARALEKLRSQINTRFPGRRKESDGTVGDLAHAGGSSDHNPWIVDGSVRVVTALDITNDVDGCPAQALVDALVASRDRRIKYIIFNRQMVRAYPKGALPPWAWGPYTGPNPHQKHCHISVLAEKEAYDDEADWQLPEA